MSSSDTPHQPEDPKQDPPTTSDPSAVSGKDATDSADSEKSRMPASESAETSVVTTKPAVKSSQKSDEIDTQPEKKPMLQMVQATEDSAEIPSHQSLKKTDTITPSRPPWTLQQFFDGEIDLDAELSKRFPSIPVMSTIKFRNLGSKTTRGVGTLSTQDGAASLIVDVDSDTRTVQMSFTFGSMLTLRFTLDNLSSMDQSRWLELMRRKEGGLAFLWGAERWEQDYLICIGRKYFTNMFAFSPHNFEAAVRLTPDVATELFNWLEKFWTQKPKEDEPPKLITW